MISQHNSLKYYYLSSKLHDVTYQKTLTFTCPSKFFHLKQDGKSFLTSVIHSDRLKMYSQWVSVNLPVVRQQLLPQSLLQISGTFLQKIKVTYQQIFRLNIAVNNIQTVQIEQCRGQVSYHHTSFLL